MLPMIKHKALWPISHRGFWAPIDRLLDEMDELAPTRCNAGGWANLDLYEDESNVYVEMNMPGFDKKDVRIELEDNVLRVEAGHDEETEDKDEQRNYYVRERSVGKIVRGARLPVAVDESKVFAGLENGVLKITLEKRDQQKKHQINIK